MLILYLGVENWYKSISGEYIPKGQKGRKVGLSIQGSVHNIGIFGERNLFSKENRWHCVEE